MGRYFINCNNDNHDKVIGILIEKNIEIVTKIPNRYGVFFYIIKCDETMSQLLRDNGVELMRLRTNPSNQFI